MTFITSSSAVHPSRRPRPARVFAYVSLAIMVGGWVAFLAALIASQQTLDDAWTAVRDLPLLAEGVVWLLGFPFLAGLAIWHASWDEAVRLGAIAIIALAYTWMFIPRERER
jgi:predicted membrane channel-forming protein YqfA (hemolysin III family)